MMSLLPGSQASEIDARVSFQLVKEQELKIFRAYKLIAVYVRAICLLAFRASLVVLLCLSDNLISPVVTAHKALLC